MHEIDLEKYELRTDMAIDTVPLNEFNSYYNKGVKVSWIDVSKDNLLKKKEGTYLTLEFEDITDTENKKVVQDVFKEELCKMIEKVSFNKNTKTLIIGLGNINSTPDSLGPITSSKVIVTKHLFSLNEVGDNFTDVSSVSPGVTGQTGIETLNYIKGIISETNPDLLIVIDALSSTSISRVNKSIQVSNSGISPGSGVGNKRKEISKETLGIPVISIGVPTVLPVAVIVSDTINYMMQNYVYNKNMIKNKSYKLINEPVNYLNKNIIVSDNDKKTLLGLLGTLTEEELINLTYEVLTPIGYNLVVTPKEVDYVIECLSDVISYGINHVLHDLE